MGFRSLDLVSFAYFRFVLVYLSTCLDLLGHWDVYVLTPNACQYGCCNIEHTSNPM